MSGVLDQIIQKLGMGGIQNTFGQGNPMSMPNQAPGVQPPAGFGAPPQIAMPQRQQPAAPQQGGGQDPAMLMKMIQMLGIGV